MMTPKEFVKDYIFRWEDGGSTDPDKTHSLDRVDNGNWTSNTVGAGVLAGSNHGVTPQALATFRGVPVSKITKEVMHRLTLDEAVEIALKSYYHDNALDQLIWNPVTASVLDFGWGVGPLRAVEKLQGVLGVTPDRKIGRATSTAYDLWLSHRSIETAAENWAGVRDQYYEGVVTANPAKRKYLRGWLARSDYFTPLNSEGWWKRFQG